MRNIKFRNTCIKNRNRILVTILVTLGFIFFFSLNISSFIAVNIEEYLSSKVKKENLTILREAFSYLVAEETNLNNLVNVAKNSKDEIIKLDFDIKECTKILSQITGYINDGLNNYNYIGYKLDVPLVFMSRSPLFMNLGPKIPIRVELSDVALGNVRTRVRDFGINNVLLEIYIEVTINTEVMYPFSVQEEKSTYEALVFSTMISGAVPSFYGGQINSKSDIISLPLSE